MKQDVIISIRHPFAEKIYSGDKLYEFRKRRPNIVVGTRCWIYEPLPVGKVTGFFIYIGCYRDEKAKVWEHCQEAAGINREAFMQYYDRDFYAHAWQVGTACRCPAFDLKDAGIDRAPQSYITWSSEFLDNLIIMKNDHPLKNCLTIQVSEEEVNSPDFDLSSYMNKKIKKAMEFEQTQHHLPFNNVK